MKRSEQGNAVSGGHANDDVENKTAADEATMASNRIELVKELPGGHETTPTLTYIFESQPHQSTAHQVISIYPSINQNVFSYSKTTINMCSCDFRWELIYYAISAFSFSLSLNKYTRRNPFYEYMSFPSFSPSINDESRLFL